MSKAADTPPSFNSSEKTCDRVLAVAWRRCCTQSKKFDFQAGRAPISDSKSMEPVLFSNHNPTHKMRCLVRLPRALAVPAVCKSLENLTPSDSYGGSHSPMTSIV